MDLNVKSGKGDNMFLRKYTKPLTKGELSKLNGQDVRVHFLRDNIKKNECMRDKIWKVRLDNNTVVITNGCGDYRAFDNYSKHYKESTINSGILVYRLPQIKYDIEW